MSAFLFPRAYPLSDPNPCYAKLTLQRSEPNPKALPASFQPTGDVIIQLRAADNRQISIRMSLSDWTKALQLNTPIVAWISGDNDV